MIERRHNMTNPTSTAFVLLAFKIRHFTYNGTDIYYTRKETKQGYEWHVEVDVFDMKPCEDEAWYKLQTVIIDCTFDEYLRIENNLQIDWLDVQKRIILAGLRKSGLIE